MATQDITPELFVENMLHHVPFDGWSDAAMKVTADELGLSASDVAKLFPKGVVSVITVGSDDVDAKMISEFMARYEGRFDEIPVHIKIRELLLIRFEILKPHKEAVRKFMTSTAKPAHAELNLRLVYNTLDRIWRTSGDRSSNFNFYTKRATLGAVYGSTMLAFLDDDTPDMEKTRGFLDRRLQDVAMIPKMTKPLREAANIVAVMASRVLNKSSTNMRF